MGRVVVSETFASLQGEGARTGVPSFFVRFGGCSLACKWCDSSFASTRLGEEKPWWAGDRPGKGVSKVLGEWDKFPAVTNLVLTGGEPLLPRNGLFLKHLFAMLLARKEEVYGKTLQSVEIETNGTMDPSSLVDFIMQNMQTSVRIYFNISPKLQSSGQIGTKAEAARTALPYGKWNEALYKATDFVLKFVVSRYSLQQDLLEIEEFRTMFLAPKDKVLLMPEGNTFDGDWSRAVAAQCLELGYTFCPRIHTILWNGRRKT